MIIIIIIIEHGCKILSSCIYSVSDWPDYTSSESDTESEVETIVGGAQGTTVSQVDRQSTDGDDESMAGHNQKETNDRQTDTDSNNELTPQREQLSDHTHHHKHVHSNHHDNHVPGPLVPEQDQTAHKILNLLSEIGQSSRVETPPFMERNFLPCKFCTGPIYVV